MKCRRGRRKRHRADRVYVSRFALPLAANRLKHAGGASAKRKPASYNNRVAVAAGSLNMASPLQSLIATGTKLWLDSIDPELVASNRALGATGATSNPIIISDLIKTGRFDDDLAALIRRGPGRRDDRLAADRPARPPGPGSVPAGLGDDQGQRRLRQLRARPAAGRPDAQHAASPSGRKRTSSWARSGRPATRTA